jgi:hypothetical protein
VEITRNGDTASIWIGLLEVGRLEKVAILRLIYLNLHTSPVPIYDCKFTHTQETNKNSLDSAVTSTEESVHIMVV